MEIRPMKNYNAPSLPTLEHSRKNPAILKNLPRRWQKKAGVLACAGFFALSVFAGCASTPEYVAQLTEEEIRERIEIAAEAYENIREHLQTAELNYEIRGSYGGALSKPFYVAYFTEQEVYGFIRTHLEAAGLNFDATPPRHSVNVEYEAFYETRAFRPPPTRRAKIGLNLYDAEKNVGIVFLDKSLREYHRNIARLASKEFDEHEQNITVGVFTDSSTYVPPLSGAESSWDCEMYIWSRNWRKENGRRGYEEARAEIISEHEDTLRQMIIENLTEQAQQFITRLQEEGVI